LNSVMKHIIIYFIIEANRRGITKMKGCAGTFWEVVIDDFVGTGNFAF
jgi:hypothetical protein